MDVKDVENTAEYTSRNLGMSYNHVGNFKNLSKAGKDAVWNTLGTLPNLLPDSSKSTSSTTESAVSNGTIEVRDADFNIQTLSRDTKESLNKLLDNCIIGIQPLKKVKLKRLSSKYERNSCR